MAGTPLVPEPCPAFFQAGPIARTEGAGARMPDARKKGDANVRILQDRAVKKEKKRWKKDRSAEKALGQGLSLTREGVSSETVRLLSVLKTRLLSKKKGMPLHPNLVNLKSNTMKNTLQRYVYHRNPASIFQEKCIEITFFKDFNSSDTACFLQKRVSLDV